MTQATGRLAIWFHVSVITGLLFVCGSRTLFSQSPIQKHPVPSPAHQTEIRKLLDETYSLKKSDSQAKKEELAKTLMDVVETGGLSTDETYVILTIVIALSKDAGKFEVYSEAVAQVAKLFDLNSQEFQSKAIKEFLRDCKSAASLKLAITEAISMARSDVLDNRFSDATSMLSSVESTNRRSALSTQVKQEIAETRKWIRSRETDWKAFQKASVVLATAPDDPDANWAVGRWRVSSESDWKTALPLFAKGSNAQWKSASILELNGAYDAMSQIAVADAWWDIAENDNTSARTALLQHAGEWYTLALPAATSLQKLRIEKRLSDIGDIPVAIKSATLIPAAAYEDPVEITPPGSGTHFSGIATTRFTDWNRDGKPDVLISGAQGYVWISLNSGGGRLAAPRRIQAGAGDLRTGTVEVTACMADLNGDSKPDLIAAHSDNQIVAFENHGTPQSPRFNSPEPLRTVNGTPLVFDPRSHSRMGAGDWDGDGDTDLLSGGFDGVIMCYRNVGNARAAKFAEGMQIEVNGERRIYSHNVSPVLFDVNQDGIADIVYGLNWGNMGFLIGVKGTPPAKPLGPGIPFVNESVSPMHLSGKAIGMRSIAGDNATPDIGDLDGDGILDIVTGGAKGKVWWLRGVAAKQSK